MSIISRSNEKLYDNDNIFNKNEEKIVIDNFIQNDAENKNYLITKKNNSHTSSRTTLLDKNNSMNNFRNSNTIQKYSDLLSYNNSNNLTTNSDYFTEKKSNYNISLGNNTENIQTNLLNERQRISLNNNTSFGNYEKSQINHLKKNISQDIYPLKRSPFLEEDHSVKNFDDLRLKFKKLENQIIEINNGIQFLI